MATLVRLTEEQITQLMIEADRMEQGFKEVHEELVAAGTRKETLTRFERLHDGFTSAMSYLRRQRALGASD